jgi:DNA polymerase III sliding clamp (beta) subunit (PCNA family)
MKIEKSVFAKKLIKLKAAVPNKTTHESLQGILLKDNYLIAYNLEIAVKAKLDIETDESYIIPIKKIDLIIKLQDGIIEIKADNNNN